MKKISLNFIFFFFIFSSLTKGAEHIDLQMELYIEDLKLLKTGISDLLQKWNDSAKTPEEKANFVKTYQHVIPHLFTRFNLINNKVSKAINVEHCYSEMSRDKCAEKVKVKIEQRHVTKKGVCNPCTRIPCLDDQVWANEFWKFISCGACCDCYHRSNYNDTCYCKATASTLGLYPVLMGAPYLTTHLIQGLGFLLTLPCRPKCSLEETKTIETCETPLDFYFKVLASKIEATLTLIDKFKHQKIDNNNELPVASTVTLDTVTLEKPDQKNED